MDTIDFIDSLSCCFNSRYEWAGMLPAERQLNSLGSQNRVPRYTTVLSADSIIIHRLLLQMFCCPDGYGTRVAFSETVDSSAIVPATTVIIIIDSMTSVLNTDKKPFSFNTLPNVCQTVHQDLITLFEDCGVQTIRPSAQGIQRTRKSQLLTCLLQCANPKCFRRLKTDFEVLRVVNELRRTEASAECDVGRGNLPVLELGPTEIIFKFGWRSVEDRTRGSVRREVPAVNQPISKFISYKPCTIGTLVPAATVSITGKRECGTYNEALEAKVRNFWTLLIHSSAQETQAFEIIQMCREESPVEKQDRVQLSLEDGKNITDCPLNENTRPAMCARYSCHFWKIPRSANCTRKQGTINFVIDVLLEIPLGSDYVASHRSGETGQLHLNNSTRLCRSEALMFSPAVAVNDDEDGVHVLLSVHDWRHRTISLMLLLSTMIGSAFVFTSTSLRYASLRFITRYPCLLKGLLRFYHAHNDLSLIIHYVSDIQVVAVPTLSAEVTHQVPPAGLSKDCLFGYTTNDGEWCFCADSPDAAVAWRLALIEARSVGRALGVHIAPTATYGGYTDGSNYYQHSAYPETTVPLYCNSSHPAGIPSLPTVYRGCDGELVVPQQVVEHPDGSRTIVLGRGNEILCRCRRGQNRLRNDRRQLRMTLYTLCSICSSEFPATIRDPKTDDALRFFDMFIYLRTAITPITIFITRIRGDIQLCRDMFRKCTF
ncbi:hypothetical protein CLF_102665 [Clonorchis sinensis]|uniref:Uncharacterized protein n=1 Tax=Clonorchis sinensis TaxID=79923 RepID=G7Y8B5_CLOSI|nr:hypothetical protein CLF_102665 [Clonorchis sinensis]